MGQFFDPKGPGVNALKSGTCNAGQPPTFHASNDIFKNTTKEIRSVAAQYSIDNEAVELRPAPGSRAGTPSGGKEAMSDIAVHDAKEGTKGGKKTRKQRPQWVTTVANYNSDNNEKQALQNETSHCQDLLS
jgi:hypothetical protein